MNPDRPETPYAEPKEGIRRPDSPVDPKPETPRRSKTESPGTYHRPPRPPPDLIGPYFLFTTTVGHEWRGTVLVLHRGGQRPALKFETDVPQTCDVLYDDIYGMTALRYNLSTKIEDGVGDQRIDWSLAWQGPKGVPHENAGRFFIPRWDQKWRGGFFSCNGFDMTVPEGTVKHLGFDNVWKHLNSVNDKAPFHILIWGGDQIYIDFIFEDIPFLKRWIEMDWDRKWKHEFSEETSRQVAEYYFNAYAENWEREEVKAANQSIPGVMQWDDHDIFDGAGSYPPELHDSPVMLGLVETAQKFRLLFQHHTTPLQARKHGLWGEHGFNFVSQMGPRLAAFGLDGRTERDWKRILTPKTWDMAFERLGKLEPTTLHLLAVFPVPFSFIRIRAAEKVFDVLRRRAPWVRYLPGLKQTNSIFGLPEFYDDLLDEWTHDQHIQERNEALVRLQKLAQQRCLRVTFLSGDVHCAAFSRFRSDQAERQTKDLLPESDTKLMYQVISSAIVNQAPTANACIAYHYLKTKWEPVPQTEEALVEMFERRPEKGKHVRHRKIMPNRNWCYFEEVGPRDVLLDHASSSDNMERNSFHPAGPKEHTHFNWARLNYPFDRSRGYPSTLGPTSSQKGLGLDGPPLHKHHHGPFCHHRASRLLHLGHHDKTHEPEFNSLDGRSGLRLRLWLESRRKEPEGRQFASYEVIVPDISRYQSDTTEMGK